MPQDNHPPCPRCGARTVKNGIHLGTQRHRCKNCGFQFTRTTPRGRPSADKALAVQLYTMGLSFRTIGRILKAAAPTILRWVRVFAEKTYEKPEPQKHPSLRSTRCGIISVQKKQDLDLECLLL